MLDAGLELDGVIARKLNGEVKPRPAPYSTSDTAAGRLLRRLAMDGIASTVEALDGQWYCTLWRGAPGRGGRLSTGSGPTRPLAIARAVLNGRLEAGEPVRANEAHRLLLRGFARPAEGRSSCSSCGVELPVRARRMTERFCGVCSWNRTKSRLDARDSPASPRSADRGAGPL